MNTDASEHALSEAEQRVREIQTKLHQWAGDAPHRRFDDLFNLVADPAFLLVAWARVRGNKGARTAGVDGQTAYYVEAVRDALVEFVADWTDPAEDQPRMSAARRYAGAVEPFASGVYVNALGDEGQTGIQRAYGAGKLARLTALKDRYDPGNVFHLNHNIRPTSE